MASTHQSFDASPHGGFIQSAHGWRNGLSAKTECDQIAYDTSIVIAGIGGTTAYGGRTLNWANANDTYDLPAMTFVDNGTSIVGQAEAYKVETIGGLYPDGKFTVLLLSICYKSPPYTTYLSIKLTWRSLQASFDSSGFYPEDMPGSHQMSEQDPFNYITNPTNGTATVTVE